MIGYQSNWWHNILRKFGDTSARIINNSESLVWRDDDVCPLLLISSEFWWDFIFFHRTFFKSQYDLNVLLMRTRKRLKILVSSHWTQDVNWTYIKRSEEVLNPHSPPLWLMIPKQTLSNIYDRTFCKNSFSKIPIIDVWHGPTGPSDSCLIFWT